MPDTLPSMLPDTLTFGTDGWRDRIGERFTTANVRRAAQATARHLLETGGTQVLVAHDTRFAGPLFAAAAADTLAANGLRVAVHDGPLPTPVLSFAVRHLGADAGVMLTASHNPPIWNGFKLKGAYGGTALDETYARVAELTAGIGPNDVATGAAAPGTFDVREAYYAHLDGLVDLDVLRGLEGTLVHDPIGGAAGGWIRGYAERAGLRLQVEEVRGEPTPLFHGAHPEPLPAHLGPTFARLRAGDALFAVATDGDGDRIAAVTGAGRYLNSHVLFALLLDRLSSRGDQGRVVKTFTVSRLVERLAAARGLEVTETPVGFKYLVPEMLKGDVLIAGEESGGLGVRGHLPERDGIANALFLLEASAAAGGDLAAQLAKLEAETDWHHAYDRLDLPLASNARADAVKAALREDPPAFADRVVESVERRDGVKLNLAGGAWVLFRASGTEPLLRLYCEAQTEAEVKALLAEAERFVARA